MRACCQVRRQCCSFLGQLPDGCEPRSGCPKRAYKLTCPNHPPSLPPSVKLETCPHKNFIEITLQGHSHRARRTPRSQTEPMIAMTGPMPTSKQMGSQTGSPPPTTLTHSLLYPTNDTSQRFLIHLPTHTTKKQIIHTGRITLWRMKDRIQRKPSCVMGGQTATRTLVRVSLFCPNSHPHRPRADSWAIHRVRGPKSNWSTNGAYNGARWEGEVCSVGRERQTTFGATDTEQTERYRSPEPSIRG